MAEEKQLPTEVTLADGRKVRRKNATVRQIAQSENMPKDQRHLKDYFLMSCRILVDGKPIDLNCFLDNLDEEDMGLVSSLFVTEEEMAAEVSKLAAGNKQGDDSEKNE